MSPSCAPARKRGNWQSGAIDRRSVCEDGKLSSCAGARSIVIVLSLAVVVAFEVEVVGALAALDHVAAVVAVDAVVASVSEDLVVVLAPAAGVVARAAEDRVVAE